MASWCLVCGWVWFVLSWELVQEATGIRVATLCAARQSNNWLSRLLKTHEFRWVGSKLDPLSGDARRNHHEPPTIWIRASSGGQK